MADLDPSRPYWPGSPYSGTMSIPATDDNNGDKHIWDAWNSHDYSIYRDHSCRFASEFGHQAPPTAATVNESIPEDQQTPTSPAMMLHQKAGEGNQKLERRLAEHFDIPSNFHDWLYLMHLNQARAVQTGVEFWRSIQPVCWGTLYWQINDCWPVNSWAAVDGYGRPKLLWFATRQFYADRILTIQPDKNGSLSLYASNDTDSPWKATASISRLTMDGSTLKSVKVKMNLPPRTAKLIAPIKPPISSQKAKSSEMIMAQAGTSRTFWFFDIDKNLKYQEPGFDASLKAKGKKLLFTLKAKTFIKDIALYPDILDSSATVSEQIVSLLPGESFTFEISSNKRLSIEQLSSKPVFQCANHFVEAQAGEPNQ